ncbi:MAG: bifunctional 5,10-methylenetetrahydrofolate dehydrogenase/5,10-methenyltetrahydrofolate cyclohydrolase [Patescibacteria group bacterium]
MQLLAKEILEQRLSSLISLRQKLPHPPVMALIWVGDDQQTATFIRAKQALAKKIDCQFFLHHFPAASFQQLAAVIDGLNFRKDIDGIVLQLPLPKSIDPDALIQKIIPIKDIDNLRGDSPYAQPTPSAIVELLKFNGINPAERKTVVLGAGRLVGTPLAKMFEKNKWTCLSIDRQAEKRTDEIRSHNLLIAATGKKGIVTPEMVHDRMVVVDGSGIDVDVETIEPLVEKITPPKGAIGPLTVNSLFENLLIATAQRLKKAVRS